MALIKCPECGKEISDKAFCCPGCGCPMEYFQENKNNEHEEPDEPYSVCPNCQKHNPMGIFTCEECGYNYKINEYKLFQPAKKKTQFHGIYKYTIFNGKQEVYCPRCGSENCSHYQEQKFIPEKTKTRYTKNLNPFRPFTLVNKKEKVVRRSMSYTESKFLCNDCGKIFS